MSAETSLDPSLLRPRPVYCVVPRHPAPDDRTDQGARMTNPDEARRHGGGGQAGLQTRGLTPFVVVCSTVLWLRGCRCPVVVAVTWSGWSLGSPNDGSSTVRPPSNLTADAKEP